MAVEPYIVICNQESIGYTVPQRKWTGAATGAEVTSLKSARLLTVEAESTAEAIRGVKALYGGWLKTNVLAVLKASIEEG